MKKPSNKNKNMDKPPAGDTEALEALKESEERFRGLFSASFGGMGVHDKGVIIEANQALSDMTGYSHEELIGMNGLLLIAPEIRDMVMNNILSGYEKPYEAEGLRKDGSRYPLEIQGKQIPYRGKTVRITEFRDITLRKNAEEALRLSEERYRHLFEDSGTSILTVDRKGKISACNREFERLTGYTSEETAGKLNWQDLVARKDDLRKMEEFRQVRFNDPDRAPRSYEFALKRKDGGIRSVEINVVLVRERMDSLVVFNDITERKEAENRLKRANKQLENIIEFLPDATLIIDSDKKIIAWNRAMQEMTGVSKEEILGKDHLAAAVPFYGEARPYLMDLIGESDAELAARYSFVNKKGDSLYAEAFAQALYGGRGAYIWAIASPLFDDAGNVTGTIESIRDIDDRKLAEAALKDSLREKEILLKEIHHRVKNNLNMVVSLLGLQMNRERSDDVKSSLKMTRSRIFAIALIHELLYQMDDLSRIDFGAYIWKLVSQLHGVLTEETRNIKEVIFVESISLDIEKAVPCGILVSEILTNAYKHAFAGRDSGTITIGMTAGNEGYLLSIGDDGIGLPEGFIFGKGESLGLELIRVLVEGQLKGTFTYRNDNGLKYAIEIPL